MINFLESLAISFIKIIIAVDLSDKLPLYKVLKEVDEVIFVRLVRSLPLHW